MSDSVNPYSPSSSGAEPPSTALELIWRILLWLAALNLAFYSALMIFGYSSKVSSGRWLAELLATNFSLAMLVKDSVGLITAMLGAIFIFARKKLGWWAALGHWSWYLTWNVIIVLVAESFAWQFPVRYQQQGIYPNIIKCLIYSLMALGLLLLPPTPRMFNVAPSGRLIKVGLVFVLSVALGFLINWWSSIR